MKRFLKIFISLIAIAAIIAAGGYLIYQRETTVEAVSELKMTDSTVDNIKITWGESERVDGYKVYLYSPKAKTYKLVDKVESNEYTFDDIDGFRIYRVKVSAYRLFLGNEYDSPRCDGVTINSVPNATELIAQSKQVGCMSLGWSSQKNVAGYELEYSTKEDFSSSKLVDTSDNKIKLDKLKQGVKYYSRCRAYGVVGEEKIYGEWSNTASVKIKKANPRKPAINNKIDKNKPMVALSFDDGPAYKGSSINSTERILNVLEKYNARATFFMVADRISDSNKYLLKREIDMGCEIGNHTYSHNHFGSAVTASDISKATKRIHKYAGVYPTIFRCPGGSITPLIRKECKEEGMPIAYWTVDTLDWKSRNAKSVTKIATSECYDGCIILMHDIYDSTADAVEKIVPKLVKEGYQIVTVSELVTVKGGKGMKPGVQYMDYKTINNNTR